MSEVINPCKGLSEYGWHFEQNVYDANGIIRSIKSGEGSGNIPKTIEVEKLSEAINTMPDGTCRLIKSQYQNNTVYNFESQGSFGATGVVNVEKVVDAVIGSMQENAMVGNAEYSPSLTEAMGMGSSPKHNNRVIKIKQATKQGFIECEIGGGILFGISDKRVETRPSNRERTDKPDSDDGEYP